MSYLKQGAAYYHYDSADRLVNVQSVDSLSAQRFYSGSALTNGQRGAALFSRIQHTNQLLGTRWREGMAAPSTRLMGVEQCNSVLFAVSQEGLGAQAYTPHGEGAGRSLPGFNGEQPDPVTGNYLLGNGYRAYNPTLMHFHSPDSLSPFSGAGLNPYGYCLGDPVNSTDPTGHLSWQAGLGIGLGVLGLAYGGYALAFGAVASSSGLSAASAAVMVAGISGIGAAGAGIAQAAAEPGSAAANTLGWISLGLGAASTLAGVAANHLAPANRAKPSQVAATFGSSSSDAAVSTPQAASGFGDFARLAGDTPVWETILRHLPANDAIALASTSSQMNQLVYQSARPIAGFIAALGGSAENSAAARGALLSAGAGVLGYGNTGYGYLPGQLTRAGLTPVSLLYRGPDALPAAWQLTLMRGSRNGGVARQRAMREHWGVQESRAWWCQFL